MKITFFSLCMVCIISQLCAQNVGIGTTNPKASAALEITSSNKGLLIPRTSTASRQGIVVPAKGLMIYDTTQSAFFYYDGGTWKPLYEKHYDSASIDYYKVAGTSVNLPVFGGGAGLIYSNGGFIYDNGGPAGNYLANSDSYIPIYFDDSTLQIKITVEEMNAETFYDSLFIVKLKGSNYTDTIARFTGTQTGTVTVDNSVIIYFKANASNQFSGFKIRWGRLRSSGAFQTPAPLYGWHYNNTKFAAMGGLQRNNNWHTDSVGFGSLSYGIGTTANGKHSFAVGYKSKAMGDNSNAIGRFTAALGDYSTAMGNYSTAIGNYSTAMGANTEANGNNSTAMGTYTNANGNNSTAMGYYTEANGNRSTAMGYYTEANGSYSTAMGYSTEANGFSSTTMGHVTAANGNYSSATGLYTYANGFASLVAGMYNDSIVARQTDVIPTTPLFIIGNGDNTSARNNAMVVLKNGNVGIGSYLYPKNRLHITGGTDLDLTQNSGFMTLGYVLGANMVMDNNDIQARNNGAVDHLYIQRMGGEVRLANNATGQVMIGTGSPDQRLSVNGNASKVGGGSWAGFSDIRLKQNIQPYSDGLAALLKIKPVWYNYNSLSGYDVTKKHIGVLAQELKEVSPYMVTESAANKAPDGSNYLSVDNSAMTFMLINAVKEQQVLIEELKKVNATLTNRIERLEAKK